MTYQKWGWFLWKLWNFCGCLNTDCDHPFCPIPLDFEFESAGEVAIKGKGLIPHLARATAMLTHGDASLPRCKIDGFLPSPGSPGR
jgi:hypothetical protein